MKIVHVVGTGTIGEPLIGLLADNKQHFGIDEVTFHKRTPLVTEQSEGRRPGTPWGDAGGRRRTARPTFEELGHSPKYETPEAIDRATVVIDCTPVGNEMKRSSTRTPPGPIGFMAQGSEYGFGKMYARGINDEALEREDDKFLHIVSCNTHNIAVLIKTLAMDADGTSHLTTVGSCACVGRMTSPRTAVSSQVRWSAVTRTSGSAPTTPGTPTTCSPRSATT